MAEYLVCACEGKHDDVEQCVKACGGTVVEGFPLMSRCFIIDLPPGQVKKLQAHDCIEAVEDTKGDGPVAEDAQP